MRWERKWCSTLADHSLGWVTARKADTLVGFVKVISDGGPTPGSMTRWCAQRKGGTLGTGVVAIAGGAAQEAGFEWLHVDLDDHRRRLHASRHPTRA